MILSVAQQIALARKHGFADAELPDLCAVIMTESGGDTEARQATGKGRGLVQIDLGEHPDVTEAEAFDPDFALDFARRLSRNPYGFGPPNWYGPGDRPVVATAARLAVKNELTKEQQPMDLWHPRAVRVVPSDGHTGLSMIGVPWKGVLHTTETDAYVPSHGSFYGNPYWPTATVVGPGASLALARSLSDHPNLVGDELHLTWDEWRRLLLDAHAHPASMSLGDVVGPGTIYQHIPIDAGAYALEHRAGWVETNTANAVQCEIVWRAANGDWPDGLLSTVADWIAFVSAQCDIPYEFAEMFREGVVVASIDSPIRFGQQEWLDANLWCGHSNVPGQEHWDPGRFPVDRLLALLDPPIQEEEDMSHITVRPGERALIPVPVVNGGAGVKWGSVTVMAPAPGADIELAQVWPSERKIGGLHQVKTFAGIAGVPLQAGDLAVELLNASPDVVVTVMVESGRS